MRYDMSLQIEEINSLTSIYAEDVNIESEHVVSVKLSESLKLFVTLKQGYPEECPPDYVLFAPNLSRKLKKRIDIKFTEIASIYQGCPIIFTWVEALKELVHTEDKRRGSSSSTSSSSDKSDDEATVSKTKKTFNIITGPTIVDRKSIFQGHCCAVTSVNDVKDFRNQLLEKKKIAQAKHNIVAYRIKSENGTVIQEVDEDGEGGAGCKLSALLQMTNAMNVVVIVTRWYGGVHLGPDRFKHINNAAIYALKEGKFIK